MGDVCAVRIGTVAIVAGVGGVAALVERALHDDVARVVLAADDEVGGKEDVVEERQARILVAIHERLCGHAKGDHEHQYDGEEVEQLHELGEKKIYNENRNVSL